MGEMPGTARQLAKLRCRARSIFEYKRWQTFLSFDCNLSFHCIKNNEALTLVQRNNIA